MSLFMIKSFIFAKSYMQYCNARLLSSDLRPCQGSEGQQLRIIALPTNDQLEACSCARIVTSGNSEVSPTFTLVQLILLRAAARSNNCSSFPMQLSLPHFQPQTLSSLFRAFHWKSARFHGPQCGQNHPD